MNLSPALSSPNGPRNRNTATTYCHILVADLHTPAAEWIARALAVALEAAQGRAPWTGFSNELPGGTFPAEDAVVRAQQFDARLAAEADAVVFVYRDVRDALASMERFFRIPASAEVAARVLRAAEAWEYWSTLAIGYEQLCRSPDSELARLWTAVDLPPNAQASAAVRRSIGQPVVRPHASSGAYKLQWKADLLQAIEMASAGWFVEHGYATSATAPVGVSKPENLHGFEEDYRLCTILKQLGFKPRTILDVGASTGIWTRTCSLVFPHARYWMAEPLPGYGTERGADGRQVHFLNMALGPDDREIEILVPKDELGAYSSTLLDFAGAVPGQKLQVRQRSVNALLAEGVLPIPDFVKIDVQGYEMHVMSGASELIGKTDVFLLETSLYRFWENAPSALEVIRYFDDRGYALFDLGGQYRSNSGALLQVDCMFVRKGSAVLSSMKRTVF